MQTANQREKYIIKKFEIDHLYVKIESGLISYDLYIRDFKLAMSGYLSQAGNKNANSLFYCFNVAGNTQEKGVQCYEKKMHITYDCYHTCSIVAIIAV